MGTKQFKREGVNVITRKVGDWVWCEYKLQQIAEMNGERVTSVSDGYFSHGSRDLSDRCFPLDMSAKLVSEGYAAAYARIREKAGALNLNYPDLHWWFVDAWCIAMGGRNVADSLKASYARLHEFEHKVIAACEAARRHAVVDGVSLFRQ